jgi:hypothetical protein
MGPLQVPECARVVVPAVGSAGGHQLRLENRPQGNWQKQGFHNDYFFVFPPYNVFELCIKLLLNVMLSAAEA